MTPWISYKSLGHIDAFLSISADSGSNVARVVTSREIHASSRRYGEIWWSRLASQIENAAAMGNSRRLFHHIRAGVKKPLGMSGTICEVHGSPTHNQLRHLVR